MLLAIIDTETTGVKDSDQMIEIACIIFDVKSKTIIHQLSTLIYSELDNQGVRKNKISKEALEVAKSREKVSKHIHDCIIKLANSCDYVLAHNVEFDKKFIPQITSPWLCTMDDFRWESDSKNLLGIANDYGIPIFNNHRALDDCNLVVQLLKKLENLEEAIEFASNPNVVVWADVSFHEKELAKDEGFRWNQYINGKWAKKVKPQEVERMKILCPFDVIVA